MVRYRTRGHAAPGATINPEAADDSYVDWPGIERWYTWCEERQYSCNVVVTSAESVDQLLESIAIAGRASSGWVDAKRTVILDAARAEWAVHQRRARPLRAGQPHRVRIRLQCRRRGGHPTGNRHP